MFDTYSERFTLDNEEIENAVRERRAALPEIEKDGPRADDLDFILDYIDKNIELPVALVARLERYAHARYVLLRFFFSGAFVGPIAKTCRNALDDARDLVYYSLPEEFDRRHGLLLIGTVNSLVYDWHNNNSQDDPNYINFAKL